MLSLARTRPVERRLRTVAQITIKMKTASNSLAANEGSHEGGGRSVPSRAHTNIANPVK